MPTILSQLQGRAIAAPMAEIIHCSALSDQISDQLKMPEFCRDVQRGPSSFVNRGIYADELRIRPAEIRMDFFHIPSMYGPVEGHSGLGSLSVASGNQKGHQASKPYPELHHPGLQYASAGDRLLIPTPDGRFQRQSVASDVDGAEPPFQRAGLCVQRLAVKGPHGEVSAER